MHQVPDIGPTLKCKKSIQVHTQILIKAQLTISKVEGYALNNEFLESSKQQDSNI